MENFLLMAKQPPHERTQELHETLKASWGANVCREGTLFHTAHTILILYVWFPSVVHFAVLQAHVVVCGQVEVDSAMWLM
eukprot:550816-Amphidinium_carterae.1